MAAGLGLSVMAFAGVPPSGFVEAEAFLPEMRVTPEDELDTPTEDEWITVPAFTEDTLC